MRLVAIFHANLENFNARHIHLDRFGRRTGDVSFVVGTVARPVADLPLELEVEAGAGLAWRSGMLRVLGATTPVSGVGPSVHAALGASWRLSSAVSLGARLEIVGIVKV